MNADKEAVFKSITPIFRNTTSIDRWNRRSGGKDVKAEKV